MKKYGYDIDLSALDDEIIRENYIFALGFPTGASTSGYVVLRCVLKPQALNLWLYDPVAEGMLSGQINPSSLQNGITGHTFEQVQLPSSKNLTTKASFIFNNTKRTGIKTGVFNSTNIIKHRRNTSTDTVIQSLQSG